MQKRKYTHLKGVEELILSMRQDGMTFQEMVPSRFMRKIICRLG